ncbi:MAG TPA: type II toxin-antitoxin system VapC family toxin [Thermoanaerobaculia bacterium]|jgi:predicted nucleic acid-binding protein|nr:type II toxin-antitoxin system VapC family toxin [Thermoanaerobaculia bacterium]
MKFWDSSALVAAVVEEKKSGRIRDLGAEDTERFVWSLTEVEIASALWRRRRADELTEEAREKAQRQIDLVLANAVTVSDLSAVARRARRLLATHNLRAADAMQLGAALLASEDDPSRLPLVTLDDRLADAARREGFAVLP